MLPEGSPQRSSLPCGLLSPRNEQNLLVSFVSLPSCQISPPNNSIFLLAFGAYSR